MEINATVIAIILFLLTHLATAIWFASGIKGEVKRLGKSLKETVDEIKELVKRITDLEVEHRDLDVLRAEVSAVRERLITLERKS